MKLFAASYLDEDVSVLVATLLRVRGLDVATAREEDMLGKPDDEQLAYAASHSLTTEVILNNFTLNT